ncbi:MAG: hypothetical protein V3V00_16150 [Saprospiraceae bacterium]
MISNSEEKRSGLNPREKRELRGKVAFRQNFKCYGCELPLIPKNGQSHLHHLDGNPKNNHPLNLVVVCPLDHWFIHDYMTPDDRKLFQRRKKKKIRYKTLPKFL